MHVYESRLFQLHRLVLGRLSHEPLVTDVTRQDLGAFLDVLVGKGLSPITVGHAVSCLRVFFRWLSRRGAILLSPAEHLPHPKLCRRIGYVPSREEVERLLATAQPEATLKREGVAEGHERHERVLHEARRDVALLELLYGSGLRFSEVTGLRVTDVDLRERTAFLRRAKGGRDRVVPITKRSTEALSRYLAEARPGLLSGRRTEVLLLTATGARLYDDWRPRFFIPLVLAAGLPKALTPHRLRHACAVHLIESGADIVYVARLLGHERLDTTALYLTLTTASIRGALESHPRERARR